MDRWGPKHVELKLKCWLKLTHWDHIVYLVGLYIYYKMIHGPYNVKLIKWKFNNLSIICAHAPTEEKSEEEKEKIYEGLQITHNKIPKHDIAIITGDLNAKIGKEDV